MKWIDVVTEEKSYESKLFRNCSKDVNIVKNVNNSLSDFI
jgi:hypothetical protein